MKRKDLFGIHHLKTISPCVRHINGQAPKDVTVLITQICEYVKVYDNWKLRLLIR